TPARTRPAPAPQRACGHHTSAHTLRTHDSSCPGTVSQRHACPRWPRVVHPARRPWDSWWDSWSDSWSRARWQGLSASVLAIRRTGVKEGLNPYVDRVRAGSRGHRPDAVNDTMAPGQKTRWNAEKTSGDVKKNAGAPDMDYVMGFRVGGGVVVRRAGTGACPYGRRHRWGRRRRDVVVIDPGVGIATTSSSSIRASLSPQRGHEIRSQHRRLPTPELRDFRELLDGLGLPARDCFHTVPRTQHPGIQLEPRGRGISDRFQLRDVGIEVRVAVPARCPRKARQIGLGNRQPALHRIQQILRVPLYHPARDALDRGELLARLGMHARNLEHRLTPHYTERRAIESRGALVAPCDELLEHRELAPLEIARTLGAHEARRR